MKTVTLVVCVGSVGIALGCGGDDGGLVGTIDGDSVEAFDTTFIVRSNDVRVGLAIGEALICAREPAAELVLLVGNCNDSPLTPGSVPIVPITDCGDGGAFAITERFGRDTDEALSGSLTVTIDGDVVSADLSLEFASSETVAGSVSTNIECNVDGL